MGTGYGGWDYCLGEEGPGQLCATANDNHCDEPMMCAAGTDSADCFCRYSLDGQCDAGTVCPEHSDAEDCLCEFAHDGMCDEGEACAYGSDTADCCASTEDGICDEGRRCPALSDRVDCFCPSRWDSECDEGQGKSLCAAMSDQADCSDASTDYSYTAYCEPCERQGHICSDFADAVERTCAVCEHSQQGDPAHANSFECPDDRPVTMQLHLYNPTEAGWRDGNYRIEACRETPSISHGGRHPPRMACEDAALARHSPPGTRPRSPSNVISASRRRRATDSRRTRTRVARAQSSTAPAGVEEKR